MKKLSTLLAALGLLALVAPTAAFAQKAQGPKAKIMAKYDTDKNGKIDGDEVAAVRKAFEADKTGELARFDTDKDGKLSDEEIAKMAPGSGTKGAKTGEKKSGGKKKDATPVAAPAPEAKDTPK